MLWTNYQRVQSMRVLRFPMVSELTGLPRSTLYLYMKNDQFPKPVKLGVRSVGWIKEEVDEWLRLRKSLRIN
ncbi:AlpA family transcriptional regulator [Acidovorax sp. BoFeN1]|uniref:AlpA family transcriptional regulator n=1 Tax=Acidovorax sp. BoFeN1 TaxID=1231053 RepID=UPI002ED4751C